MSQAEVSATPLVGGEVDPLVGTVLDDRYQILRVLGAGGMGKVYEASHVRLPRHFAIKVIHQNRVSDPTTLERFKREAEITSSLGCVHIIDVVDFHTLPTGAPYIVMELLRGEDLAARIARTGPLAFPAIHTVLRQVVSGLSAAHARGVLHRDIKPENIFLAQTPDHGELVKVLDFGLSKIMGANLTPTRSLMGTPYYMSPEQARGDEVDVRTDVYALGVMAYQLLTGRLPYEGESAYEILTRIATQEPVAPSHWKPELAGPIEDALQAALVKVPAERVPSVDAFWARLGPLLEAGPARVAPAAEPGPVELPPAVTLTSPPSPGRGAVVAAALALMAVGLWAWWPSPRPGPAPSPAIVAPRAAPTAALPDPVALPVAAPSAPAPTPAPAPVPAPARITPAAPGRGGTRKAPTRHKATGSSGDMILEGV